MKRMRISAVFLCIALIVLLCSCMPLLTGLEDLYQNQFDYPETGSYHCQELGMTLSFSSQESTVTYAGKTEILHVHNGGRFILGSGSTPPTAFYDWDNNRSVLVLEFDRVPPGVERNTNYYFYLIPVD